MSLKANSYAYDPQGNRHDTYLKDGVTMTLDGQRLGAGWTSQTAGGVFRMGEDGRGVKVESHNQPQQRATSNVSTSSRPAVNTSTMGGNKFSSTTSSNINYGNQSGGRNSLFLKNNPDAAPKTDYQGASPWNSDTIVGGKYDGLSSSWLNSGGRKIFNESIYKGYNQDDLDSAARPDRRTLMDKYGDRYQHEPQTLFFDYNPTSYDDYPYMVAMDSNGYYVTVDRRDAKRYESEGYKMIAPSRGTSDWEVKEALFNDQSGAEWKEGGRDTHQVGLMNKDGRVKWILAQRKTDIDKAIREGYDQIAPESQSINRALQSGFWDAHFYRDPGDRAWDNETNSYRFTGDGRSDWGGMGSAIDRKLGVQSQPSTNVDMATPTQQSDDDIIYLGNGNAIKRTPTKDGKRVVNIQGKQVEMEEEEYINELLSGLGIEPILKRK